MWLITRALALAFALALVAAPLACSATDRLRADVELTVPLSELSGLAIRKTANGSELLAVGDEATEIVALPIEDGVPNAQKARHIPLPMVAGPGGSELEGIAVDGDGKVWVLAERGEIFAYTIDGATATEVWRKSIVVPPGHLLETAWQGEPNARGEGLGFVENRVFITKQKDPAALVELSLDGDHFVAASTFTLKDMDDASDLQVTDAGVFVIGARSQRICKLERPGLIAGALACEKRWNLPASLGKGKTQWEGLAFLADGKVVVGVDRKKFDRPNVAVLPALP